MVVKRNNLCQTDFAKITHFEQIGAFVGKFE